MNCLQYNFSVCTSSLTRPPCLLCRCRVSSPVWRSAALRCEAFRKLWKPSGWTRAGWRGSSLHFKNGSNIGTPSSLCPTNSCPSNWGKSSRQLQCLHYCRTASPNSLYPGQSTNRSQRLCSTWVDRVFYVMTLVLWDVVASSGWLWLCIWQSDVRCKLTLLTLYAVDQTSPLQVSSEPHAWADNHAFREQRFTHTPFAQPALRHLTVWAV